MQKDNFTLQELTDLGDGCRSFLYSEIKSGRLRARKRGRRTIVLAEDREAWRRSLPAFASKHADAIV